jgi:NAD(P)-dependent dehydrogenase (short-subunit alcohol dehydrogenase family)
MLIANGNLTRETLKDKTALVTGAGGGIGFETCRSLLWLGAKVVIAEIDGEKGGTAVRALNEEFGAGAALFVRTDVGDERQIRELKKRAIKSFGKVDIVINNATLAPLGAVEDTPISVWDSSYRVNLRGPALLAREFLPEMRRRNSGVFVCVSSLGTAYMGAYESMKAAQVHLANTLDAELEGTGVVVFTIGPGYVPTGTAVTALPKLAGMMGLDLAALQETLKEQTISVEAAGAGFAAAAALAEQFRGQETASMAALAAAGIDLRIGDAPGVEYSESDFERIRSLAAKVRRTLGEQYDGYRQRSVFEQQWLYRTFKKYAGGTIEDTLQKLGQVEEAAGKRDGVRLAAVRLRAEGVATYHGFMHEMAKGYVKDPKLREEQLAIVWGWKEDAEHLADAMKNA